MNRAVLSEMLHLFIALVLTIAVFRAAAWSYPVGRASLALVGWGTGLVVIAMSVPGLLRAWRKGRGA